MFAVQNKIDRSLTQALLWLSLGVSLFTQASCGKDRSKDFGPFAHYVGRFEQASIEAKKPVVVDHLEIGFDKEGLLPKDWAAGCYGQGSEEPEIFVNEKVWKALSEPARELILFHELGHCVLNRDHVDGGFYNQNLKEWVPRSIMNRSLFDAKIYEDNRAYFIQELFHS